MLDVGVQDCTTLMNQPEKILWNLDGHHSDRYEHIVIDVAMCLCPVGSFKQNFAFIDSLGAMWTTKPASKASCFKIRLNHRCLEFSYSGLLQYQNIK